MDGKRMEKLTVFGADRFDLLPDRVEAFAWLACGEGLPCRDVFEAEWQAATELLRKTAAPQAAILREDAAAMSVFITLGPGAERRAADLFRRERYVLGSLMNTLCDQTLFQMDRQLSPLLQELLAAEGLFIATRLEPRVDLSPAEQRRRFSPLKEALPFARVSRRGALYPAKSMMYCLTLTAEPCGQRLLHDCARCGQTDCPYRDAAVKSD